jgi:flagellar motor switch protein FliN/FliY
MTAAAIHDDGMIEQWKRKAVAENDNVLSDDEIEALLQTARKEAPAASSSGNAADRSARLDADEIETRMQGSGVAPHRDAAVRSGNAVASLQQAESRLAAALAPAATRAIPSELGTPSPFDFQDLSRGTSGVVAPFPLSTLQDVELDLRIELGRTELLIDEVLKLREGSVVSLDKLAGDPVDILVNGQLVARGEVLVLNDNFCVRVAEILTPEG